MNADFFTKPTETWRQAFKAWDNILDAQKENPMVPEFLNQSAAAWRDFLKQCSESIETKTEDGQSQIPDPLTAWSSAAKAWEETLRGLNDNPFVPGEALADSAQVWREFIEEAAEIQKSAGDPAAYWKRSTEAWTGFTKKWEALLGERWQAALRDKALLEKLGGSLSALSFFKERRDRALERFWEECRLPSAADVERVYERLGELQERIDELEEAIAAPLPADQD